MIRKPRALRANMSRPMPAHRNPTRPLTEGQVVQLLDHAAPERRPSEPILFPRLRITCCRLPLHYFDLLSRGCTPRSPDADSVQAPHLPQHFGRLSSPFSWASTSPKTGLTWTAFQEVYPAPRLRRFSGPKSFNEKRHCSTGLASASGLW